MSVCPSLTMCASSKIGEMGLFTPDLDGYKPKNFVLGLPDLDSVLRLKSNLSHKNSYPDWHHLQGGMTFAAQIIYYYFLFVFNVMASIGLFFT